MSSFALSLFGVRKRYGRRAALDGLNLQVPAGSVFGLVGPNGAGKTTTFSVVSGTVIPDQGQVDVLGRGPFRAAVHAGRVGVLPQDAALNPHSSARELLTFYARLQGMDRHGASREADRLLDVVQLADRARSRVGQLSHGMRRRLAVAQALLGDPELVLLDEPTGGLDPHLAVEMRDLLRAQRGQRTVVVSTHILSDVEHTCDHVAFLEKGRALRAGPLAELTGHGALVRIQLSEPIAQAVIEELLEGRRPELRGDVLTYHLAAGEDPAASHSLLLPALMERGARILEVRLGETLEAAYLATRGDG